MEQGAVRAVTAPTPVKTFKEPVYHPLVSREKPGHQRRKSMKKPEKAPIDQIAFAEDTNE